MRDEPAGATLTEFKVVMIVFGAASWAILWFWPVVGNISGAYSGIDYLLNGIDAVAGPFFAGAGLLVVVATLAASIVLD